MKWMGAVLSACLLSACGAGSSSGGAPTPAPTPSPTPQSTPTPSPTPAAGPVPTHFVVFVLDDLSVDDANFMQVKGGKYTPQLDALAAQSTVLTNYQIVTPVCTASRYSLLTGNYPSRATNGVFQRRLVREGAAIPEFNVAITAADMTLPRRLQALGYRTGFTGKDHVSDTTYPAIAAGAKSSDPGMTDVLESDRQLGIAGVHNMGFDEVYAVYPANVYEWPVTDLRVHNLDWIVDGALKFIDANADKKFFLEVSLTVPHYPFDAAHSWNADPRATPFGFLPQAPNVMPARSTLTSRVKTAGYPGNENFLWMDDAIGAVLDSLKSHGLSDSTAILVEGDNGVTVDPVSGETLKGEIYIPGTWTPAFWYYRGIKGRIDELTSNLDFQPTILEITGQQPVGDGVSLLPLLEGNPGPVRPNLYLEIGYARSVIEGDYQYIAVRHTPYIKNLAATKGFPLTHWVGYGGPHALELITMKEFAHFFDPDQLYNFRSDPGEQNNLYGQINYQATSDHLRGVMRAQASKMPGTFEVGP